MQRQPAPAIHRNPHFERGDDTVVADQLILAVTPYSARTTDGKFFDGEQWIRSELAIESTDHLAIEKRRGKSVHVLELAEPGDELPVGHHAAILGRSQCVETDCKRGARGECAALSAGDVLLEDAQRGHSRMAIRRVDDDVRAARNRSRFARNRAEFFAEDLGFAFSEFADQSYSQLATKTS